MPKGITTVAQGELVATNLIYGEQAIIVPSENYEILDNVSTIMAGAMQGSEVKVHFKDLSLLNRNLVYVLPVTVSESTIEFLKSTRTTYFVIKGAALINTVGNITKNYLQCIMQKYMPSDGMTGDRDSEYLL